MRYLLVLGIWVAIVGGMWLYTSKRDAAVPQAQAAAVEFAADRRFSIEITPTFSIENDPFALQTTETAATPLEVRFNGTPLEMPYDTISRGATIRVVDVQGVMNGNNEIYVKASPPMSETMIDHGIRIRFYADSSLIADQTVWSSQGSLVSGTASFDYRAAGEEEHDH